MLIFKRVSLYWSYRWVYMPYFYVQDTCILFYTKLGLWKEKSLKVELQKNSLDAQLFHLFLTREPFWGARIIWKFVWDHFNTISNTYTCVYIYKHIWSCTMCTHSCRLVDDIPPLGWISTSASEVWFLKVRIFLEMYNK